MTDSPETDRSVVTLFVNGAEMTLCATWTMEDLVLHLATSPKGIAVAVEGEILPRSLWASTPLEAESSIEIVTAAAGG